VAAPALADWAPWVAFFQVWGQIITGIYELTRISALYGVADGSLQALRRDTAGGLSVATRPHKLRVLTF